MVRSDPEKCGLSTMTTSPGLRKVSHTASMPPEPPWVNRKFS